MQIHEARERALAGEVLLGARAQRIQWGSISGATLRGFVRGAGPGCSIQFSAFRGGAPVYSFGYHGALGETHVHWVDRAGLCRYMRFFEGEAEDAVATDRVPDFSEGRAGLDVVDAPGPGGQS